MSLFTLHTGMCRCMYLILKYKAQKLVDQIIIFYKEELIKMFFTLPFHTIIFSFSLLVIIKSQSNERFLHVEHKLHTNILSEQLNRRYSRNVLESISTLE